MFLTIFQNQKENIEELKNYIYKKKTKHDIPLNIFFL